MKKSPDPDESHETRVALLEQRADRSDETMLKIAEVLERVEKFMAERAGQRQGIGMAAIATATIINIIAAAVTAYATVRLVN